MPHSIWHTAQEPRLIRTVYQDFTSFLHYRHSHLKLWYCVRKTFTTGLETQITMDCPQRLPMAANRQTTLASLLF